MEKYIEIAEVRKHINYDWDKADNAWTDTTTPCPCCGRPVKEGKGVYVHMIGGGDILTLSNDDFGAGDMEWYEVGKTCYRTLEKLWKTATAEELHKLAD